MGNCQAIDNAALVIQHPSGREDKLYWPVTACEIMKMNPGHYVALLLSTTTLCPSSTTAAAPSTNNSKNLTNNNINHHPVRITRIKLLRPTDTLVLGHAYRLITTEEVMWAKKYAKMKKKQPESAEKQERMREKPGLEFETARNSTEIDKTNQVRKHEGNRPRTTSSANSAAAKLRTWQPSLHSISEAAS
ncbi:unnamed protein product [Ilex paraguariensis]